MEIGSIFAISKIEQNLYSVHYKDATSHIWEELLDNWNDVEYLNNFFRENISYLNQSFWKSVYDKEVSVAEAIDITMDLAERMEEYILEYANSTENGEYLSPIFSPLVNDNVYHAPLKSAYKTQGPSKTSWLRVYAIKIEDTYIITGGAIKLTKTMQEMRHTLEELNKLQNVASELKRNHFTGNSDFDFMYFEI